MLIVHLSSPHHQQPLQNCFLLKWTCLSQKAGHSALWQAAFRYSSSGLLLLVEYVQIQPFLY